MSENKSSPLISVMGTKVPGNEGSWERKEVPRNESSTYGTFGPGNESSLELSFLGRKVPWYESSSYPWYHPNPLTRSSSHRPR